MNLVIFDHSGWLVNDLRESREAGSEVGAFPEHLALDSVTIDVEAGLKL